MIIKWNGDDTLIRGLDGLKKEVKKGEQIEVTEMTYNNLVSAYGKHIEKVEKKEIKKVIKKTKKRK